MVWLGKALSLKSLWRGLFGEGFWSQVIRDKYLKNMYVVVWLRKAVVKSVSRGSIVWKALMDSFPFLFNWFA